MSYKINGAVFEVNRVLGVGSLQKAYENAFLTEFTNFPHKSIIGGRCWRVCSGTWHKLEKEAKSRAEQPLDAHRLVRTTVRLRGLRYKVEPHIPQDVLGIYVYLPVT